MKALRMKKLFLFLLSLYLLNVQGWATEGKKAIHFNDLTIIVSSCDKYAELWHPFFTFLFKQWPSLKTHNLHIPILLIANKETYKDPRVTVVQTGTNRNWANSMLEVLKSVKTKYVLYFQEDYFLNQPVNEEHLYNLVQAMDEENVAHMEIAQDDYFTKVIQAPLHPTRVGIAIKPRFSEWRTSLSVSLWRKEVLEWLIKPGENPWLFEEAGTFRSQGMKEPFWTVVANHPLAYLNACHNGGWWRQEVFKYVQSQGIEIAFRKLPIDKDYPILRKLQVKCPWFFRGIVWLRERLGLEPIFKA